MQGLRNTTANCEAIKTLRIHEMQGRIRLCVDVERRWILIHCPSIHRSVDLFKSNSGSNGHATGMAVSVHDLNKSRQESATNDAQLVSRNLFLLHLTCFSSSMPIRSSSLFIFWMAESKSSGLKASGMTKCRLGSASI